VTPGGKLGYSGRTWNDEDALMSENILVVSADELRRHHDFHGFLPLSPDEVQELYDALDVFGMDRDKAEHDPTYKQLVAYTAIRADGQYLSYLRGKDLGEARLHGNRSIGIGGHINSDDHANLFLDDRLKVAAYREVDEEVSILQRYTLRLAGLLNDDSNDVGKVHIGLVYVAELDKPNVKKRERGIAQIRFVAPEELRAERDQYETWSQILIDSIDRL
jgi:predicted NUDIX family phosphoesterase